MRRRLRQGSQENEGTGRNPERIRKVKKILMLTRSPLGMEAMWALGWRRLMALGRRWTRDFLKDIGARKINALLEP